MPGINLISTFRKRQMFPDSFFSIMVVDSHSKRKNKTLINA